MVTPADCWANLQRLLAALAAHYSTDFRAAVSARGLGREPVGVLLLAANIDPEPISSLKLLACLPYFAETAFSTRLERLAAAGFLEPALGGYGLTAHGRATVEALHRPVRATLTGLAPMPPADLERVALMLERLFLACRASPQVTEQGCIAASGNRGPVPAPGDSPLARIARMIEALANFRCDAHRAAWRTLMVGGPAWETLTWLWQGAANSSASLRAWAEQQPFPRGKTAGEYYACLAELANRGWAAPSAADDTWTLTPAGRQTREAAEAQTDALFYEPWAALTEAELSDLNERAATIAEALRRDA